jgi:hypothetical protein
MLDHAGEHAYAATLDGALANLQFFFKHRDGPLLHLTRYIFVPVARARFPVLIHVDRAPFVENVRRLLSGFVGRVDGDDRATPMHGLGVEAVGILLDVGTEQAPEKSSDRTARSQVPVSVDQLLTFDKNQRRIASRQRRN